MLTTVRALLIPGGLIFLAAVGFLRPQGLPAWVQGPVSTLPYIVLAFGIVFGWYLASSRLLLSLVVLTLADRALLFFPPLDRDPASVGRTMFAATSFLLPLNLLALSLVKEEALSTWRGIMRSLLVLIQPFLVLWLALPDHAELAGALRYHLTPLDTGAWSALSQPALLAFLAAMLMLTIRFVMDRDPLDAGALWAVIASYVAFEGLRYGWAPGNFLSAAGLILLLTLVQAVHQRAYRDDLTGLPGKQAYVEATAAAMGSKYVLAVVGIDQLKQYGNQHGKAVSEQLLRLIARKIQAAAGPSPVYRLAGEEFTVLFPRRTATETLVVLEAIRKAVEQCPVSLRGRDRVWEGGPSSFSRSAELLPLTASIGVAEGGAASATLGLVTKAAFRALYEAKGQGGNLVKRGTLVPDVPTPARAETGRIVAYTEY